MGTGPAHFPALFFQQVEARKDRVALRKKEYGIWNRITWEEYGEEVRVVAAGLISLGLKQGDRVAILGDNRPEWLICHLAAMSAGFVTCGIYATSAPEELAYVVSHSEARILFVENEEQVDKALQIESDLDLKKIVVWDPKGLWGFSHPSMMFFDEFMGNGKAFLREHPACVSERMAAIDLEETAMMIYTSGTTGRPKGAMLTHRNIFSITESFMEATPMYENDEMLSYLPLAHIYENLLSVFLAVMGGGTVNFVESLDTLPMNLREVSPTVFFSVPRIWEKFASMIEIKMSDSTLVKRAFYRAAIGAGLRHVRSEKKSGKRFLWGLIYWPLYGLVLYHLKRQVGLERV